MTIDFYDRKDIAASRGTFVRLTLADVQLVGRATELAFESGIAPIEMARAAVTDTLCRKWIRRGAREAIATLK